MDCSDYSPDEIDGLPPLGSGGLEGPGQENVPSEGRAQLGASADQLVSMLRARLLGPTRRGPNVHPVVSTTHDNTAEMRQLAPNPSPSAISFTRLVPLQAPGSGRR